MMAVRVSKTPSKTADQIGLSMSLSSSGERLPKPPRSPEGPRTVRALTGIFINYDKRRCIDVDAGIVHKSTLFVFIYYFPSLIGSRKTVDKSLKQASAHIFGDMPGQPGYIYRQMEMK